MSEEWQAIKESLRSKLPSGAFKVWIDPIQFLQRKDDRIHLGCPNTFFISWVKENYLGLIMEAWKHFHKETPLVHLVIVPSPKSSAKENDALQIPFSYPEQKPIYPFFNDRFTFDKFVAWGGNQYAYSAALAMATQKNIYNNTLFLSSDTGLGKSHLTQAIGHQFARAFPRARILYITAEDFTNEIISSLKNNRMEQFCDRFRKHCDLLLLEEVHFLGGKERSQDQMVRVLDMMAQDNKKVIITSPLLPRDMPRMNRGLKSRLGAGVIGHMEPPDQETRVKILDQKAKSEGIDLPGMVLEYLASQPTQDIRILESCLIGLAAQSRLLCHPIDLKLARTVIEERIETSREPDISTIQSLICKVYQISLDEICSRSRMRKFSLPRSISIFLCRKFTRESLESIGRAFHRDHATVLYTIQRIEEMYRQDRELKNQVDFLSGKVEKTFSLITALPRNGDPAPTLQ